jgi:hypothetical protein
VKEKVVASKIAENAKPEKKKLKLYLSARRSQKPCKAQNDKPGQSLLLGIKSIQLLVVAQ